MSKTRWVKLTTYAVARNISMSTVRRWIKRGLLKTRTGPRGCYLVQLHTNTLSTEEMIEQVKEVCRARVKKLEDEITSLSTDNIVLRNQLKKVGQS